MGTDATAARMIGERPRTGEGPAGLRFGIGGKAGLIGLLIASGCLAAFPRSGSSQTLEECLALARLDSPVLRAADADLAQTQQAVTEARAAMQPTLRLGASYLQNSEGPKAVFQIPGTPAPEVFNLGSANQVDVRTDAAITLYSGGQNPALIGAARAANEGSARTRDQIEADLTLTVSEAFYRATAALQMEGAARDAASSARSHLEVAAARVRAGVAPRLDSLRAQVDLSERVAALDRADEDVRLRRIELETAIGAPLDTTRALVAPGPPEAGVPSFEAEVSAAIKARPELAVYDLQLRETEARITAARAARRPQVTLSGTAEYLAPNVNAGYFDFNDPGLKTYKLYAELGLSLPLLDGGLIGSKVGQLEAQRVSLEARRQDEELAVRREVEQALSDLGVALAVWPSDENGIGAARESLRLAEEGYKNGTSTATDVRDAESALADALAEEAQTGMNYWIARASLDHATGAAARREK